MNQLANCTTGAGEGEYPSEGFKRTGNPQNVQLYVSLRFTGSGDRDTLDLEFGTTEQADLFVKVLDGLRL